MMPGGALSAQTPAKRPRDESPTLPSGDSEAASATAGDKEGKGDAGGQPAGDGGGSAGEGGGGAGSGGGSTPPSGGEQPRPSRVHSGDMVLHPHAIKA